MVRGNVEVSSIMHIIRTLLIYFGSTLMCASILTIFDRVVISNGIPNTTDIYKFENGFAWNLIAVVYVFIFALPVYSFLKLFLTETSFRYIACVMCVIVVLLLITGTGLHFNDLSTFKNFAVLIFGAVSIPFLEEVFNNYKENRVKLNSSNDLSEALK